MHSAVSDCEVIQDIDLMKKMAMVISTEFEVQNKLMPADTDLGSTLLRIWMIPWLKLYWRRKIVGTGGIGKIKIRRGSPPLFVEGPTPWLLVDRQLKVIGL